MNRRREQEIQLTKDEHARFMASVESALDRGSFRPAEKPDELPDWRALFMGSYSR